MNKGKIIVIEGACDGIGKTTQYKLLRSRLASEGYNIFSYKFPSYGTPRAIEVEKFLRGEYGDPKSLSPKLINSFYADDRKETWNEILRNKYDEGEILLLDRYTTSSVIYQSAFEEDATKKDELIDYFQNLEYNENHIARPDLVIFLKASFDLVTKLRNERKENEGIQKDVFEKNIEYQRKIYFNALYVAKKLGFQEIQCDNGDKLKTIDEIHESVYRKVKKFIK